MPEKVQIVEVGARDGLQNERVVVSTDHKIQLIRALIDAGVRRLEVASFVHPTRVPQMADAEAVVAKLPDRDDVSYIGLCLNKRGALRALATRAAGKRGVDEIGCVVVASNSFGTRNQGQTSEQSLAETAGILRLAADNRVATQVSISVAFGCPYEGSVPSSYVTALAGRLAQHAPAEIALADTIGAATPEQVAGLFQQVRAVVPESIPLRAHFHDTRGTGLANVRAAYDVGVRVFDASIGGLGGCPYAPGAPGNIATESLVDLMRALGVDTNIDLHALVATREWLGPVIERTLGIIP
jgi:hydroxymethylglutaryl-CoA lyase